MGGEEVDRKKEWGKRALRRRGGRENQSVCKLDFKCYLRNEKKKHTDEKGKKHSGLYANDMVTSRGNPRESKIQTKIIHQN